MLHRLLAIAIASLLLVGCGDESAPDAAGTSGSPGPVSPASGDALVTEAIAYEEGGQSLEGFLVYRKQHDATRRPGVLVIHQWWGLGEHVKERARRLAGLGYVAFCVDMYGTGKLTDDPKQAQEWASVFYQDAAGAGRKRILAGLDVLAKHPKVNASKLGAIGFCYGGSVALELAWSGADVRGVVCFHGTLVMPDEADAKKVKAEVLVLNGADDAWIPPEKVAAFEAAMKTMDIEARVVNYEGAVHAYTDPASNERGMDNIAYDAKADEASWSEMTKFFQRVFRP